MKMISKTWLLLLLLLFSFFCQAQKDSVQINQKRDSQASSFVEIAANPELKGNGIKRFLIGKNYRREWTEPLRVRVLNLKSAGLIPKKEGGGKETRSLQVEDSAGNTWSLRSIKKYPANALAPELRHTLAEKIVSDDISASYPYGALSMGVLSEAAGVPYLKDSLVYLPDDPALGEYRDKYANHLMLWEEREPSSFHLSHQKDEEKSISTEELVYKLAGNSKNRVDQITVLRARLLDNFVMDFDRHEGQWNWIGVDSGKLRIYYSIPKDRDQVFYTNQGLLPGIMKGKERLPEIQGFKVRVKNMNSFNRTARNFDRSFLNELSEEDWSREVDHFLQVMTDSVIEAALHRQPAEIQKFEAGKIIETLKKKRDYFRDDVMRYYRSLSQTVVVVGTNEKEQFSISKKENGSVSLTINQLDSLGHVSNQLFHREFDPSITKEIRLYGLEGDDRFIAEGGASKIKIRMIGGPGDDQFISQGNHKKLTAYDVSFENNSIEEGIHNKINSDPQNNVYTRLGYNYKLASLGPTAEISATEGLFLGLKFKLLTRGFRKDSFAMRQVVVASHSLNSSSVHLRYNADFVGVLGRTDLLIRGDMMVPTNRTNFFGLGNTTSIDQAKNENDYYHARYDLGNLALLARTNLTSWMSLSYGPSFQHLHLRTTENYNKLVYSYFNPQFFPNLYQSKFYGGGEAHLLINTRNDQLVPTRGIVLHGYIRALAGLNSYSSAVTQTGGSLSLYTDFISKGKVVLATVFGGGHNAGRFELEQAQTLGFVDHLRGYRVQRFSGRSSAYNNTELRIRIADVNAYLFPAVLGVYGFNDVGRVWTEGESSNVWHDGYGGGVWIAPLNRLVVTGYLSFSKEEKALPWVTIGFVF